MPENNSISNSKGRCFVNAGFGIKTGFATGRKLNLNKSYKLLSKPAAESNDLSCTRTGEILHYGSIDFQMYKELLVKYGGLLIPHGKMKSKHLSYSI